MSWLTFLSALGLWVCHLPFLKYRFHQKSMKGSTLGLFSGFQFFFFFEMQSSFFKQNIPYEPYKLKRHRTKGGGDKRHGEGEAELSFPQLGGIGLVFLLTPCPQISSPGSQEKGWASSSSSSPAGTHPARGLSFRNSQTSDPVKPLSWNTGSTLVFRGDPEWTTLKRHYFPGLLSDFRWRLCAHTIFESS